MQSPRTLRWLKLVSLVAVASLLGCSRLPLAPKVATENGVIESAPVPPRATTAGVLQSTSKVIDGLLGGSLTVGDWKVVVPKGAFSGIATITITVPDPSVRQCDLQISPGYLNNFLVPVNLFCNFGSVTESLRGSMFWWDPSAKVWRTISSLPVLQSRYAPLSHFSTYRGGRAGW